MQTPAEKHLVHKLVSFLSSHETDSNAHRILNAGAGQSVSIERKLKQAGCRYICDRIDIENCNVDFPTAGECWQCSIDDMRPLSSGHYIAVFANYLLEHSENIGGASQEICRVLAPGGLFVATVPNTLAPEFVLARHTPLWFHKLARGELAWETKYAYGSISELLDVFLDNGFRVEEEKRWPFVEGYLWKYPIVGRLGKLYDKALSTCKCRRCMGNVCIALRKPT
jgi:SAM-dependent methyltransferase